MIREPTPSGAMPRQTNLHTRRRIRPDFAMTLIFSRRREQDALRRGQRFAIAKRESHSDHRLRIGHTRHAQRRRWAAWLDAAI